MKTLDELMLERLEQMTGTYYWYEMGDDGECLVFELSGDGIRGPALIGNADPDDLFSEMFPILQGISWRFLSNDKLEEWYEIFLMAQKGISSREGVPPGK